MLVKSNTIKSDVWRLIFIPAASLIFIIAASLTYLCIDQLSGFIDLRAHSLVNKTAHLVHKPLQENNQALVQHIVDSSLEEPYIRAVRVYDSNRNNFFHAGPEFWETEDPGEPNLTDRVKRETYRSIRYAEPLVDKNNQNPIGWIEMELMSSAYLVMNYKAIILTAALTLLCLILVIYYSFRIYERIAEPIEKFHQSIDSLAKGDLDIKLEPQESAEFDRFALSINHLSDVMRTAQLDMQTHINQAFDDLNETMETLESKNVELDIARKEALEASRLKSEFLANTSHEIRTPLNAILGFVNLLFKSDLSFEQKQQLETIQDSAMRLQTVMNGVLDFSKIESDKLTLDYSHLPLRKLIDEVIHSLAPLAYEKHLQIFSKINAHIPQYLLGDSLRLKQIISALLNNAIKYSKEGNIQIIVEKIEQFETQINLQFSVIDQGIGLSQDEQKQLFSPFNQLDRSISREHEGMGLSLALCKKLVERMHGSIKVVSEKDKGSSFTFTARFGIDQQQPDALSLPNFNQYKFLICGENIHSQEQIQNILQEWRNIPDGISAIHDCFPAMKISQKENRPYDLMILDISPNERKIPPVLLSNLAAQLKSEFNCQLIACCTPAHQVLFRNNAVNDEVIFLNKPISYQDLYQSLCNSLAIDSTSLTADKKLSPSNITSILLVDDNPANLQFTTELLKGLNTDVTQACNGLMAIEACQEKDFDLIFMDIQMPGMDGIEASRQIRQLQQGKSRTPIVALTAHSITEQKPELLIAGMDDCLSKPVNESQLIHIINRWACLSGKKEISLRQENSQESPITEPIQQKESNQEIASVDIALCLRLSNNKPALARDMLKMLISGIAEEKQLIMQAMQEDNFSQASELIHKLYGSSCYCGVPRLKYISGLLDKLFQKELTEEAKGAINSLYLALDAILEWSEGKDIDSLFGFPPSIPAITE